MALARDPRRNRDFFISLIAFSICTALTYAYLILAADFPAQEWANLGLILLNVMVLLWLYPWREHGESGGPSRFSPVD